MYNLLSKSIGQIAIVTPNLDKTIDSYFHRFNISEWEVYNYGPEILNLMKYKGKDSSYTLKIGLTHFGNTRMEFIQPLEGQSIHMDYLKKHQYGVQHLGVYVHNIEEEIQLAKNEGINVIMEGGGFGLKNDGRFAYLDTLDMFGVTYELIQRPIEKKKPLYIVTKENF